MNPSMNHVIVKKHSSPEVIDRAFSAAREFFSHLILDYCKAGGISLDNAILSAECRNPALVKQFILEGAPAPTGIDLERILRFTGKAQEFGEQAPITIGSELSYPQAMCGTKMAANLDCSHVDGTQMPEALDRQIKRILSVVTWFYMEASKRYLSDQNASLPPIPQNGD